MVDLSLQTLGIYFVVSLLLVLALATIAMSIIRIGPNEVGLVIKRWGREKKSSDGPVSHHGEAGYQADFVRADAYDGHRADREREQQNEKHPEIDPEREHGKVRHGGPPSAGGVS